MNMCQTDGSRTMTMYAIDVYKDKTEGSLGLSAWTAAQEIAG